MSSAVNLFSDEMRRNPYPAYTLMRQTSPLLRIPPPFDGWMVFDYQTVKRVLYDQETFSSRVPAPRNWFIFEDPPAHTKLRGLISKAFTPRIVADLDPRIRQISREILDGLAAQGEIDIAAEYSVPLPIRVIAGMIGMPDSDLPSFRRWSDTILQLSYSRSGGEAAAASLRQYEAVTVEMNEYLTGMIAARTHRPQDDLLTGLMQAEIDGERLSQEEILGFFQLVVIAGQETTSDLINNALLCLLEHPDQLARLRANPSLMPPAIEEVLRYRSPLQWMMRTPRRDVELHGTMVPAGALLLPMIGSANRDADHFSEPHRFDIARDPNPHLAFGHGAHFCVGAALSRLEARIALSDLLQRFRHFERSGSQAWKPRPALHVHGPASLVLRFELNRGAGAGV